MLLHVERHRQKAPSAVVFNALQCLKNSEGRLVQIKGESKGVLLEQGAQGHSTVHVDLLLGCHLFLSGYF